eukprot:gene7353-8174_t
MRRIIEVSLYAPNVYLLVFFLHQTFAFKGANDMNESEFNRIAKRHLVFVIQLVKLGKKDADTLIDLIRRSRWPRSWFFLRCRRSMQTLLEKDTQFVAW